MRTNQFFSRFMPSAFQTHFAQKLKIYYRPHQAIV